MLFRGKSGVGVLAFGHGVAVAITETKADLVQGDICWARVISREDLVRSPGFEPGSSA